MIKVTDLRKSYAGSETLHGLNFSIEKGEIVGFLGPNGAGKTTTMRILTGYMPPTSGLVSIAGYNILEDSLSARKHIGYLPEHVPLYLDLTVDEYLQFFAKIIGTRSKTVFQEVYDAKEKTGLHDVSKMLIGSLSRGFRQRVGLAQALLGSPEVLILDEPTVGLDPVQIIEIRELIKNLAKHQTVILSTHILPEVSMICNRVLIINKGNIVADSTTDALLQNNSNIQKYSIAVSGDLSQAEKIASSLSGASVSIVKKDGKSVLHVESKDTIRAALLKALVNAQIDIIDFNTEHLDLESVFLKLVTDEKNKK